MFLFLFQWQLWWACWLQLTLHSGWVILKEEENQREHSKVVSDRLSWYLYKNVFLTNLWRVWGIPYDENQEFRIRSCFGSSSTFRRWKKCSPFCLIVGQKWLIKTSSLETFFKYCMREFVGLDQHLFYFQQKFPYFGWKGGGSGSGGFVSGSLRPNDNGSGRIWIRKTGLDYKRRNKYRRIRFLLSYDWGPTPLHH